MGNSLKGTKSHDNLKGAFAGESQANRRYLYFARRADIEGFPDIGGLFRDTSEAETGHAFGHLDWNAPFCICRIQSYGQTPRFSPQGLSHPYRHNQKDKSPGI